MRVPRKTGAASCEDEADNQIRIEQLSHTYAGAPSPALDNVTLTIARGALFGLLGPNGAGKTTLISVLTGILPLQKGEVRVLGKRLSQDRDAVLAMAGLVPQDYAFYPRLTGRENLRFFAGINGFHGLSAMERMDRAISICGIEDHLDRMAGEYSGGLKRRLNLAIGLLNDPRVLYLDEPTVGIDTRSRRFILDAIKALKTAGNTVIYTSHYMEEVEQLCDTVAIIDRGRVIAHQPIGELLRPKPGLGADALEQVYLRLTEEEPLS